jgi:hypothetical protein
LSPQPRAAAETVAGSALAQLPLQLFLEVAMSRPIVLLAVLLGSVVLTLLAVAQEPASYARDVEPIFVKSCTDCHGAKNPKEELNLSAGKGLTILLGKQSEQVSMPLVKAGDPAGSYLWLKLSHTASKGKGMPRTLFGAKKLPADQLALIQRWIVEGAKP